MHSIVIMSGEDNFKMRRVRPAMLNSKNWVSWIWKFQLNQVMRSNNLLGIIDGSVKRPMTTTGSDTNQKDIENWNALDGWTNFSTSVELALMRGACHVDIVIWLMTKTAGYLWIEIRGIEAGPVGSLLRHYKDFERDYQIVAWIVLVTQKLCNISVTCNDEQIIARIFC